jgi:hypothetical protein
MSLTEAQNIFASINEDALNDMLRAFFGARPRYLVYGSPAFVSTTTVAATSMPAIPFPGVPGGIQWQVRLSVPHIDLYPKTSPLPPQLQLPPGSFSLALEIELCIACQAQRFEPEPLRPDGMNQQPAPVHMDHPIACPRLQVFAIGSLQRVSVNGEDGIAFSIAAVEIVDIMPDALESVLECLLLSIVQSALSQVRLPLRALRAGAFPLTLTVGPTIEDNRIDVRGLV